MEYNGIRCFNQAEIERPLGVTAGTSEQFGDGYMDIFDRKGTVIASIQRTSWGAWRDGYRTALDVYSILRQPRNGKTWEEVEVTP